MAGALKSSEVVAECNRLEISPSKSDAKSANVFNGRPGGSAKAGGGESTSTLDKATKGVPGYGGGYAKRRRPHDA